MPVFEYGVYGVLLHRPSVLAAECKAALAAPVFDTFLIMIPPVFTRAVSPFIFCVKAAILSFGIGAVVFTGRRFKKPFFSFTAELMFLYGSVISCFTYFMPGPQEFPLILKPPFFKTTQGWQPIGPEMQVLFFISVLLQTSKTVYPVLRAIGLFFIKIGRIGKDI